jgi:hypothetical protein
MTANGATPCPPMRRLPLAAAWASTPTSALWRARTALPGNRQVVPGRPTGRYPKPVSGGKNGRYPDTAYGLTRRFFSDRLILYFQNSRSEIVKTADFRQIWCSGNRLNSSDFKRRDETCGMQHPIRSTAQPAISGEVRGLAGIERPRGHARRRSRPTCPLDARGYTISHAADQGCATDGMKVRFRAICCPIGAQGLSAETRRLQPFPEAARDQVVFHEPDFQTPSLQAGGSRPVSGNGPASRALARSTIRV